MDLAVRLREQARTNNERRVLVLAGTNAETRRQARDVLETAVDVTDATYVGPASLPCECLEYHRTDELLGTTRSALILDCHERCEPNLLGRLAGTVDGGGLLVLLTPPLSEWPNQRDDFDETLAAPPYERTDVSGNFRTRLVETLRTHRGVAIVDVGSDTVEADGLTTPAPRRPTPPLEPPASHEFPVEAYEACRTQDQLDALGAFERLRQEGETLVVEADRGRGKSSVAGLAAACLAREGMDVLVTAPRYRNAREVFARARELLAVLGERQTGTAEEAGEQNRSESEKNEESGTTKESESANTSERQQLDTETGRIRFLEPADAAELPGEPDRVIVDEAAGLPVGLLGEFLDAGGVAFTTTVHGYEGAGRGFDIRFRDRLARSSFEVTDVTLTEPIRYAPGDPVEVWSFRALALDARPPVPPLVADATPSSVTYRELSPADFLADEQLLKEVFGLLVLAHYRTEPNDLARLLDAPNISVHALVVDGNQGTSHPVSVALLAREGNLPPDVRRAMEEGQRISGNMLPDVLAGQLRDGVAAETAGDRVMRIATHSAARSCGLGSHLLSHLRERCDGDWLGVGFGATPELVSFWRENGFRTVHVSTSRNDRSGEHSVLMLDPLSESGEELLARHTAWFLRRFPGTLTDALSDLDPDVVRAAARATAEPPALDLDEFEWRIAAGIPRGSAILATAPRPVRRLTLRHLVEPNADVLSEREERLLVRKALQCASWETVREELAYPGESACMRALGEAVGSLVDLYGDSSDAEH